MPDREPRYALHKVGIFAGCTDAQLRRLDSIVQRVAYPDGAVICNEGDEALDFHVVLDGQAVLSIAGQTVQTCGPGAFFGELAMLAHRSRHATARASGDSLVGAISAEAFEDLLIDMPVLARRLLHSMAERIWEGLDTGGLEVVERRPPGT